MSTLLCAALLAATPIALEQVREESRAQNSAAVLADLAHATSQEGVRLARSAILPQVWLTGSASANVYGPQLAYEPVPQVSSTGAITGVSYQVQTVPTSSQGTFNAALNIGQLIYDGGRWWNALFQAGEQEGAARLQLSEQRNASEYEGVRRFLELLRAEKSYAVLGATSQRSREQLERARALFQAGHAPKGDVYAAQVNLGNDQIAQVKQAGTIVRSAADLAVWLGRPGRDPLTASDPGLSDPAQVPGLAVEPALDLARRNRPLLQALAASVRAADLGVLVARSSYLPKLSANAAFGRQGPSVDPVFTDPRRQNYFSGNLVLRWDLFSGFQTDAQMEQAHLAKRQAEVNLQEAAREVEGDTVAAVSFLSASVESWRLATGNKEAADQAVVLAAERYRAGAGSQLETQDAQLKLTQSELAVLSSRIDIEIARANLDRVTGTSRPGEAP